MTKRKRTKRETYT